ncbi:hypothetical protein [Clostridium paraputrificum]|uniref:hypothetical protein n=1 Tax=Clostridium paraputrificum TaxID=29363 RepID=UPI0004185DD7|nr:hypothetical protein [Clostridium paraputrificum]MDB2122847.1 hypothetical protein [Clostridium paraputrificum]
MARRRMFSLKIVDSARFLKMPTSSQLLYFHLGMRADDDGVVEGFNVLRMTGLNEDDLKILVAKGYVQILNEDLVSFITDWREHNLIRADRKVDSIYKDLLLKVLPQVEVIEPRERADLKKEGDNGRPKDNQATDNGQHRLGKDRLGKVNNTISKDIVCSTKVQPIIEKWNSLKLQRLVSINQGTNRYKLLNARIKEYGVEGILKAIDNINNSSFLKGQNKNNWTITFDWLIKPNNFIKVLEDNYSDRKNNPSEPLDEESCQKIALKMF